MGLGSTFRGTSLPPESLDSILFSWTVAHILVTLSLSGPGSAVTKFPDHPTVIAVVYSCQVSDSWPHPGVENPLVEELVKVRLDPHEWVLHSEGPGHVGVVDCSPEPGQDGGAMERSVPHDVELFARHQPGTHCGLLSRCQETVHVSAPEGEDRGVSQDWEPPEPSYGELCVEIANGGQVPGVTEINEAVVTVQLTEQTQSLHNTMIITSHYMTSQWQ